MTHEEDGRQKNCVGVYIVRTEIDPGNTLILRDLSDAPPLRSSESRHTRRAQGAVGYVSSGAARLFTTFRTPSTDFAVFSASSFSARDRTVPVRVTTPLSAWTCTVFRGIAFVE